MEGGPGGAEDEYVVMATERERATTTVQRRAAAAAASSGLGASAEEGSGEVGAGEVEVDVPGGTGTGEGLEGFIAGLGGDEGEEALLPQQAWQPAGAEYLDRDLQEEAGRHPHAEWPGPPQSRPSGLVNFSVLGPLALLLFALSTSSMLAYLPSALPQLGAMLISAPQGPPHHFNATAVEAQHQLLAVMENSIARVQVCDKVTCVTGQRGKPYRNAEPITRGNMLLCHCTAGRAAPIHSTLALLLQGLWTVTMPSDL